jgi:hypothetical protein
MRWTMVTHLLPLAVASHQESRATMPERKEITGRDAYIMVEALTFTIEALSGLPVELRPDNNITDMKRLIEDFVKQDVNLSQSQLIARRRLQNVLTYVARPDR